MGIVPRILPAAIAEAGESGAPAERMPPGADAARSLKAGADEASARYERKAISEALARNGGNKSKTARDLEITRKTLALKMAKYGQ